MGLRHGPPPPLCCPLNYVYVPGVKTYHVVSPNSIPQGMILRDYGPSCKVRTATSKKKGGPLTHNAMVLPDSQGGGNPDRHSETCAKFNLSLTCRDTCKQAMIAASDCRNTVLPLPLIISVSTNSYFFCR